MLDIPKLRENQEMLALLTHNNSLLMEFFSYKDKDSLEGQEILSTIRNNSEKIGFFSSSNNYMIEAHLFQSLDGKPDIQQIPVLQLPAPEKKKRGRPKGKKRYYEITGTQEVILEYAKKHRGIFSISDFRLDWNSLEGAAPSFAKTTVFAILGKLAKLGLCEKLGPGEYKFYSYKIPGAA